MRPPASCSGFTAKTKASAGPWHLANSPAAAWPIGPTGPLERIIYVTPGYQMVALDAKTGIRIPAFGKNGIVDLKDEDDQQIEPLNPDIGLHSAPVVPEIT